jgi:hypothetical protein
MRSDDPHRLYQQFGTSRPTPPRPDADVPRPELLAALAIVGLGVLALSLYLAPRLCLLALCLLAGVVGAAYAYRRGWRYSAGAAAAGAILAAGILVLVPGAWGEWSVLTGYLESTRQAEQLQELMPVDTAGFQRDRNSRRMLAEQYPNLFAPGLRRAEEEWLARWCTALSEQIGQLAADDWDGVDKKRQLRGEVRNLVSLSRGDSGGALLAVSLPAAGAADLDRAEADWGNRASEWLTDRVGALPAGDRPGYLALRESARQLRSRVADVARFDAALAPASSGWGERSTRQVADELAQLAPNDLDGFRKEEELRRLLRSEFPALTKAVESAEEAWGERSAAALVASLEAAPAGDCDGLARYQRAGERLTALLPTTRRRLQEAEQVWVERTVVLYEKRSGALPADDWDGYDKIRAEHARLVGLAPGAAPRLAAAEWAWAGRVVDAAVSDARPLLDAEPLKASEQLRRRAARLDRAGFQPLRPDGPPEAPDGPPRKVRTKLLDARRDAARAALTAAQRQARELIREDRYQAALAVAKTTEERLGPEARALQLGDELTRFHETCAFVARLAREARKEDPK